MTSRKSKTKQSKKAKTSKKAKAKPSKASAKKRSGASKKAATSRSRKPTARKSSRKAVAAKVIPHEFYEHQVYASSDAYSLVESADPSELVRQVQLRCNDGWATVGGVCHSGQQFYQALVKSR